jgi:hypothetical protein
MAGVFDSSSTPSQVFPEAAVADSRQIRQIAGYTKRKIR